MNEWRYYAAINNQHALSIRTQLLDTVSELINKRSGVGARNRRWQLNQCCRPKQTSGYALSYSIDKSDFVAAKAKRLFQNIVAFYCQL